MRSAISKGGGNSSLAGRSVEGMGAVMLVGGPAGESPADGVTQLPS
jgi:hypothetical protein